MATEIDDLRMAVSGVPSTRPTSAVRLAACLLVLQSSIGAAGIFTVLWLVIGQLSVKTLSGVLTDPVFFALLFAIPVGYVVAACTAVAVRGLLGCRYKARDMTVAWCVTSALTILLAAALVPLSPFHDTGAAVLAYALCPLGIALSVCVVVLLTGRDERRLFPSPPPPPALLPERTPRADTSHRVRRVAIVLPAVLSIAALSFLAFPHVPTLTDLERSPEGQLRYPGAVMQKVVGKDYTGGDGWEKSSAADMYVTYSLPPDDVTTIADWYRTRLSALGYQYLGCSVTEIPTQISPSPTERGYAFQKGPNTSFGITFTSSPDTFVVGMTTWPPQDPAPVYPPSSAGLPMTPC